LASFNIGGKLSDGTSCFLAHKLYFSSSILAGMRKQLGLLVFTSALALISKAQFRSYSNEFLNIGAGAKGLAMGGAVAATVGDATAGYWNPAGLVGVKAAQISFMHSEYFAGIGKYDFASFALPIHDGKRALGISVLRFAVDDIPNTLFLVGPDGKINYDKITSFSSADYALLLSYAQKLKETENENMSFGANVKVIHRSAGDIGKAWGFGLDAGFQYRNKRLRLGAMVKDLTTTFNTWSFTWTEAEKQALIAANNDVPTSSTELTAPRLIIGAAYDLVSKKKFRLTAEANLETTFDGKRNTLISSSLLSVDPRIGLEASINESLFLRGGVTNFQQAYDDNDPTSTQKVWTYQPSFGAGFRLSNVKIDYAFVNLANQSNPLYSHVFSLVLELVKGKSKGK
jgi:hypothetical protein